jgi:hypothetical protein
MTWCVPPEAARQRQSNCARRSEYTLTTVATSFVRECRLPLGGADGI